jgi:GNAT superfamily N-acetyltransferase
MTFNISDRLSALSAEALAFVSRDKTETMARQWLGGHPSFAETPQWLVARSLALELALSEPSLMGATAFDRLARAMKGRPPDDIAAATLLRRSRIRLARLSDRIFEDLATDERLTLLPTAFSNEIGGGVSFGLFTEIDGAHIAATRPLVPLDDEALVLARSFVRPGNRGLGNGVRCAEAVYRHIVRNGLAPRATFCAAGARKPKLPFRPDENRLDALAAAWATLGRDPTAQELAQARCFANQDALMEVLLSVSTARNGGAPELASAYTRIAAVLVETLALRAANGSARGNLDAVASAIDAAIAGGTFHREGRNLFDSLRERVKLSAARPTDDTADLDRLVHRIRALRAKTVEQGCTEQEALAAAEKVAELLDRYRLNLSELDLRKQSCEGIGVETDRKRRGPIDDCMATIAAFFDCRVWAETGEDATLRYIFFGLPADVQATVYLHDLIARAFVSETATFQAGEFYRSADSGHRRSATNSFQLGLARGINQKLQRLRQARDKASVGSNGRALVPIKDAMIDDELERLGLTFHRRATARKRVLSTAYNAGKEAGERFEYRPGIEQG